MGLGLFNLIPLPPLDGSKVLDVLLPERWYHLVLRYERYLMLAVVLLAWSGAFGGPLTVAMELVLRELCRVAQFPFALVEYYFSDDVPVTREGGAPMDGPIYHLERVVKVKAEDLEDFVGPLDLILHLLNKNKMEIKDIQISLILDQYLQWMSQRKELDLEVASEFVTMASPPGLYQDQDAAVHPR